ncbi:MAG TPA: hypothetical protein VE439_07235 [Anaerolineae bacterium]|nr:hypothetical protein [Anaerolineae bacterium]
MGEKKSEPRPQFSEISLIYFWPFFYLLTALSVGLAIAALFGVFSPGVTYFFYAEAIILVFLVAIHWFKIM